MKNLTRFFTIFSLSMILFSACNFGDVDSSDSQNLTIVPETSEVEAEKAYIKIQLGDNNSRSILPSLTLKNFVLKGNRSGEEEETLLTAETASELESQTLIILTGNWSFTMTAEIAEGSTTTSSVEKYAASITDAEISNATNSLLFDMRPVSSSGQKVTSGELGISITLSSEAVSANKAKATVKKYGETESVFTKNYASLSAGSSVSFEESLDPGTYEISVEFYYEDSNERQNQNTWQAIARITQGLKSSAIVTDFNLSQVYTISYQNIKGAELVSSVADNIAILTFTGKSSDITLPVYKKSGYYFMGWYESENPALADVPSTAKETFSPKADPQNKTFYALWANNTVYVANGGNGNGFSSTSPVAYFGDAISTIGKIKDKAGSAQDFTIKVCGEVNGAQTVSSGLTTATATSLTIEGFNGLDENNTPKDSLNGGFTSESKGTTLTISTTVPVTIKNLLITGGYAENGGGIYNSGTLSLADGCLVSKNTATKNGGGVYSTGTMFMYGSAVIGDSKKTTAATNSDSGYSNKAAECGGGIYSSGNLYLGYSAVNTEATLTGGVYYNYAFNTGGIYQLGTQDNTTNSTFTLKSGSVSYNSVRGIYTGKCTFNMTGGTINGNTAPNKDGIDPRGGGLYAGNYSNVMISGGSITSNVAGTDGGGIYIANWNSTTVVIEGGTISGNSASGNGNGIAVMNSSFKMQGGALVDSSNDVYLASGKVITITGALTAETQPIATVTPATWTRGTTIVSSTLDLSSYKTYFAFTDDTFETKLSSNKKSLITDAPIYVAGTTTHPVTGKAGSSSGTGTKVAPCDSVQTACALMNDSTWDYTIRIDGILNGVQQIPSSTNVNSLTIQGTSDSATIDAVSGGPALQIYASSLNLTILKLTIKKGLTSNHGGGIMIENSGITLTLGDGTEANGVTITGNKGMQGGGIYNAGTLTITKYVSITSNTATAQGGDFYGGGIYNTGTLTMTGGEVSGNTATNGAGIYNDNGTIYICGDTLIGNVVSTAPTSGSNGSNKANNGGAIYNKSGTIHLGYKNNNGTAQKDDSASVKIMGNAVKTDSSKGGAIYVEAGTLNVAKTTIAFNYSPKDAGGIYTKGTVSLVEDAVVKGNNASGKGGGVYVDQNGQLSMGSNSIIGGSGDGDANTAASGGGVYVSSSNSTYPAIVTFGTESSTQSITGNSATSSGGGICVDGFAAKLTMHSGIISNNKVVGGTTGGGGLSVTQGAFNMEGGTISGNYIENASSTSIKGGAIDMNTSGTLNIRGTVSIPYESGKNDVCLRSDPITITGALGGSGIIAAITADSWSRGKEVIKAGTDVTSLASYLSRFQTTNEDWDLVLSSSTSITIDAPFYVAGTGRSVCTADGNDTTGDGTKSKPYATIAKAVEAIAALNTSAKYTINIDGTVTGAQTIGENLNGKASSLTIVGVNPLDSDGKPTDTLNGNSEGPSLTVNTSVSTTINNLKITGGTGMTSGNHANGGGILNNSNGNLTLASGCLVTGNSANTTGSGGGVYNLGTLTITGAEISGNTCEYDGAGVDNEGGTLTMSSGKISGNTANYGGGVHNNGTFKMTGGTISGNYAKQQCGGVYQVGANATFFMSGTAVIGDSSATKNATNDEKSNSSFRGSGIYIAGGKVYIGYTAENSVDTNFTGGIYYNYSESSMGGGIYIDSGTTPQCYIAGGSIKFNGSASGKEKGVHVEGSLTLTSDVTFATDNDIFVKKNKTITVAGTLNNHSATNPITITPEAYEEDTQVLSGDAVGTEYKKFSITQDSEHPENDWHINSDGKLTTHWIGSKKPSATRVIGDIIFNDGSAEYYTSDLNDEQKNAAVAVIFYDGVGDSNLGNRVLGVALNDSSSTLAWATTYANGHGSGPMNSTPPITVEKYNGKTNFAAIKALGDYKQSYYPAFYYAEHYGDSVSNLGDYTEDWYLPAYIELSTIKTNMSTVNAAFDKLGSRKMFLTNTSQNKRRYWSSTNYFTSSTTYSQNDKYGIQSAWAWDEGRFKGDGKDNGNICYVRVIHEF